MEYTDKELLELLYETWVKNGSVRCEDFRPAKGLPHYAAFSKRFGSWENAKELAGVKQNNRRRTSLSKSEILQELKLVYEKTRQTPKLIDFVKLNGKVGEDRIRSLFGSYENLLKEADLTHDKYNTTYKKDFLISEIKRFVSEFNRVPMATDFESLKGYPSRKTFYNQFGDFKTVVELAGYEYSYKSSFYDIPIEDRKLLLENSLLECYKKLNKIPTIDEFVLFSKQTISRTIIRKDFGSYSGLLTSCGLISENEKINGKYTDGHLKNEFDRFVKENGRIPQIHEFNNSGYPSFWCYQSRFGSWNKAVESYGYEPTYTIRRYELPNGELCDSLYELKISTWLQENGIDYERNIPYTEICKRYKGKMNCDYMITVCGKPVYVEMAGFLPRKNVEWERFSVEEKNYARKMRYKKKIMDRDNVLYYVIYPHEINNSSMEDIYKNILGVIE